MGDDVNITQKSSQGYTFTWQNKFTGIGTRNNRNQKIPKQNILYLMADKKPRPPPLNIEKASPELFDRLILSQI